MSQAHKNPEYLKNRGVVLREQPICTVCNRQPSTQVDHIIPVDAGGEHDLTNLRGICAKCNNTLGHRYVKQRNELKQTIRADAMRDNGIEIQKSKPFFTEKKINAPTQVWIIPNSLDQPELAGVGREQPRLETVWPEHAGSFVDGVRDWAREFLDVELMAWQCHALEGQLLYDDAGDLCNRVSLVSTARQNGKTIALAALVGWWLTEMPKIRDSKQTVLTTAHRLDLSVMLYDLVAPVLKKRFNAYLMSSYGRNAATMPDGSKWFVRAANNSVGHGMSADLIVADEMWDIARDVIDGGLLPAQRARKSPLLSLWSTAGTEASTAMLKWREQGLRSIDTGKHSSFYFAEWSPPPDMSPLDPASWRWANPALGQTLELKTIEAESENPDRASFLRASCNLWIASDKAWIQPGQWPQLHYKDPIPAGGTVAIECALDDSRYFGVRCVVLPDHRTVATVEFVVDTYEQLLAEVDRLCAGTASVRFAITPTIDLHWPVALERKRIVVGYGEILKFTPRIKSMIGEKLLLHTGEAMLAEHVQRAVAVRSQNSIALSSQRSPGPIELARCMVWAAALASRPTSSGKPMIVVATR